MCVFDAPEHVPVAKAEEHKKRYSLTTIEPLTTEKCDDKTLPKPWSSALATRKVRAEIVAHIANGLVKLFNVHAGRFKDKTLVVSGALNDVLRVNARGASPWTEHQAVTEVGEGDLAVAYWAQQFHDQPTVVRVLDSDQIPILQLRAHLADRVTPLYVWLVTPKKSEDLNYHGYLMMPHEEHTLVDINDLNREIVTSGLRVEEFCYQIICKKTDFVEKVISNLGVQPSLAALEKNPSNAIRITASAAQCDGRTVRTSFKQAITKCKRKRAELRELGDVEMRRAWWTLCYWAYGWRGRLPREITPREAFGFDDKGARASCEDPFPTINFGKF